MAYSVSVAGFQSSCIFVSYVSIGPFDCVCVVDANTILLLRMSYSFILLSIPYQHLSPLLFPRN